MGPIPSLCPKLRRRQYANARADVNAGLAAHSPEVAPARRYFELVANDEAAPESFRVQSKPSQLRSDSRPFAVPRMRARLCRRALVNHARAREYSAAGVLTRLLRLTTRKRECPSLRRQSHSSKRRDR